MIGGWVECIASFDPVSKQHFKATLKGAK